jgi:hypothetical protein
LLFKGLARGLGVNYPSSLVWLLTGREGIEPLGSAVRLILRWPRYGKSAVMTKEIAGMFARENFIR